MSFCYSLCTRFQVLGKPHKPYPVRCVSLPEGNRWRFWDICHSLSPLTFSLTHSLSLSLSPTTLTFTIPSDRPEVLDLLVRRFFPQACQNGTWDERTSAE